MSSFTGPHPLVSYESTDRFQGGRRFYRLTRDLTYDVGKEGSSLSVTVPKGFETDLCSIPALGRVIFSPDGPEATAGALHDFLYREGLVSRFMADWIFREALKVLGIPTWRRAIIFCAVRIGGRRAYCRPKPPEVPTFI